MLGKLRINKKSIAFFAIVPVLIGVSLVQMPCPICDGSGHVSVMPGMENVHIMNVEGSQITAVQNICEMFTLFQYDMSVKVTNTSHEEVHGWLKLVLRDYAKGAMLDRQYVSVHVPAEATADISFKVWFRTGIDVPLTIDAHAEQVTDDIQDDVCNGTGRLPLNMWLVVDKLKGTLQEISRDSHDFTPPAPFYPADGGSWSE